MALTFAKYSVKLLFPECDPPDDSVRMLAAVCICVLAFINCWNVKWATTVQDVFTYAKLLALFVIMATGIVQLGKGKTQNFNWDDTETDFKKIALSFYSGLFAYNGWNYLNFVIEELKDPVRNLPRAIGISIILVTIVYTLTNIAFYTTLSVPEVLGSEAVAVVRILSYFFLPNNIWFIQTFAEIIYGRFAFFIPVFVAMSTFGGKLVHTQSSCQDDISRSQRDLADLVKTLLCRGLQRPDAGDPLNDPSVQIHTSSCSYILCKLLLRRR